MLPPLGECFRNPSVSVKQLVLLWEAAFGFNEFFFWRLNVFAHFMMSDLRVHLLILCCVFRGFWAKTAQSPCWTHPIHPILPRPTFFVSPDEKIPQRETSCQCGRGETKTAEVLKGVKIDWVQKVVSSEKNVLIGVLHQIESTLKVTEVKTCKNKYTVSYK